MTRIIRVAILECDTPIDPVKDRYGTYGDFFSRLLTAGLQGLGAADVELQTTKWDVVNNLIYPEPEEFDALLLTGSSAFNSPIVVFVTYMSRTRCACRCTVDNRIDKIRPRHFRAAKEAHNRHMLRAPDCCSCSWCSPGPERRRMGDFGRIILFE
jgi:hypothetical protein